MSDSWGFGFGAFSNFGLSTKWDNDWEGRFITGGTQAKIQTLSLNPVLAFKLFDNLTLSAGPVLQYVYIQLRYQGPNVTGFPLGPIGPPIIGPGAVPEAGVKLNGEDWDWGWNVGLLYQITDTIKFGASYRSQISHSSTNGNVKFSPEGVNNFNDTSGSAPLNTPAIGSKQVDNVPHGSEKATHSILVFITFSVVNPAPKQTRCGKNLGYYPENSCRSNSAQLLLH